MIPDRCPTCNLVKHIAELNDNPRVEPKIKLNELVQITGHGFAMYRVLRLDGNEILLEIIP